MMVGTNLHSKGGVSSVIQGYFDAGIMERLGIQYYPTHCDGSRSHKVIFYMRGLFKIIINMPKCNIVHVHTSSRWSFRRLFLIILFAKILSKKVVIHLHGGKFDIYYSQVFFVERITIRYGFFLADKVIVLSNEWLKKIRVFCDSKKVSIIPNSVLILGQRELTTGKKSSIPHTILFMGNMVSTKGVYDLLQAIELLNLDNTRIKVFLCGNGEIENVKKRVADLGLNKIVNVPGWVSGREKKKLLNEAYLYVLPSYFEGLPMSILEAMATGTPVISTPVGGIPYAVKDGYNGFLVPVNSPKALAAKIERLLVNEKLWAHLAQNAFKTIKNKFSIDQTEKKLLKLYHSICRKN